MEGDDATECDKEKGGKGTRLELVPERQMYLKVLRGEQDTTNKIPYAEWTRDAKDHITGRGSKGRIRVELMK